MYVVDVVEDQQPRLAGLLQRPPHHGSRVPVPASALVDAEVAGDRVHGSLDVAVADPVDLAALVGGLAGEPQRQRALAATWNAVQYPDLAVAFPQRLDQLRFQRVPAVQVFRQQTEPGR